MTLARITITIDEDTLDDLRERAGEGGVSAFVVEAIRARLRTDPIRALLDDLDQRHGPLDADELAQGERWWHDLNQRLSSSTPEP